jgi:phosphoribosylaminoimidazolecarboxamide formyltransferase/IMP cyclohydrolase
VTQRQPTEEEWTAMLFGWVWSQHVKSNAIIYAGADRTLGIGAGQMSRGFEPDCCLEAEQPGFL